MLVLYLVEDDVMKYDGLLNFGRSDLFGLFQVLFVEGFGYFDRFNIGRSNLFGFFQVQFMGGFGQFDRFNIGMSNNFFQVYQFWVIDGFNENFLRFVMMWSDLFGLFFE